MRYAAFLRGLNVGGSGVLKMANLSGALEKAGLSSVKTFLASGNVTFEAAAGTPRVRAAIEKTLREEFGLVTPFALRKAADVAALVASCPFGGAPASPDVRWYVSFLARECQASPVLFSAPPDGSFRIVATTALEVFSVVLVTPAFGTSEAMAVLEKAFGKEITTRSWNTLLRMFPAPPIVEIGKPAARR